MNFYPIILRVLESIAKWRNDLMDSINPNGLPIKNFDLKLQAESIIQQCTLNNRFSSDQKLILLFKFASFMGTFSIDAYLFSDAVKSFIAETLHDENRIERFASILT